MRFFNFRSTLGQTALFSAVLGLFATGTTMAAKKLPSPEPLDAKNLAKRIRENVEALAPLETRNVGKPIGDARWEADAGAKVFEYYAGAIGHLCGQTIPVARGGFDFTLRQPMGVIAALTPWNFPFIIAC